MADKRPGNPPMPFNPEIGEKICELISNGTTLRAICRMDEMPSHATVYKWTSENAAFADALSHARKLSADAFAEMVIEEAFSSHDAQIGRLRVDALKWTAKVLAPKKYGDKIDIETQSHQDFKISFSVPDRQTLEIPVQSLPAPVAMLSAPESEE